MSTMMLMESANLFAGDEAEGKHLTLNTVMLPKVVEATQDHVSAAIGVAVDFATHIEKLEAGFKLTGVDPGVHAYFGTNRKVRSRWTFVGVIRDKRTGAALESRARLEARLSGIEQEDFEKGNLIGCDYTLKEIMFYDLHQLGQERIWFDFFSGRAPRFNGETSDAEEASILRII